MDAIGPEKDFAIENDWKKVTKWSPGRSPSGQQEVEELILSSLSSVKHVLVVKDDMNDMMIWIRMRFNALEKGNQTASLLVQGAYNSITNNTYNYFLIILVIIVIMCFIHQPYK